MLIPMTPIARRAYQMQKWNAKRRTIDWQFTPDTWWDWWLIDDRWSRRGVKGNQLCMARYGDAGPYAPQNVYCATQRKNTEDASEKRQTGWRTAYDAGKISVPDHVQVRGSGHPRSQAVLTPKGRFESAALAGDAYGISRQHAAKLARNKLQGWAYEA